MAKQLNLWLGLTTIFLSTALMGSIARADKIRTAVPGLNLNYLTVFSAGERRFFRDEGLENETIVIAVPPGSLRW